MDVKSQGHNQDQKKQAIQIKLIEITRQFLSELERKHQNISLTAAIQRDLGIDSLGRVELFHRVEEAFHIRLAESVMVEAETLNDLIDAIIHTDILDEIPKETSKRYKQIELGEAYNPSKATSLVEVLQKWATKDPKRPHIYLQSEKEEEKIITYGELLKEASMVAAGLESDGVRAGDTIAIMLPTSEDFFAVFLGILLLGAIPVPIYPPFRPDKLEEYAMRAANILKNAEIRLLITFQKAERLSELLKVFISSLKAVITVDMLKQSSQKFKKPQIKETMSALIQYTSGSTSLPKGVLLSHQNLLANIRAIGQAAKITSTDVGVSWLPLYHDMGLIGSWLMSLYHGNPIVILSPLSFLSRPERWLWNIHYHRGTISGAPNFAYELCIRRVNEADIVGLDLSSWRLAFNGAEEVNPQTLKNFIKKFEPYGFSAKTMFPVYGLAESSVALAFPTPGEEPKIDIISREILETEQRAEPVKNVQEKAVQFVCCGTALPEHELRIVDKAGKVVAERQIGQLQFRGPSAMMGYYRQPEATNAIYHEGWWDSGDLAYQVKGEIYITGRKKDIIIKAGRNLHPEEIEEITSQVSGVRKGCVVAFGVNDPKWGTEKLIIVAESHEKKSAIQKKMQTEIQEKMAIVLGVLPDEVLIVPPKTISKTSSGKLQRSACKEGYLTKKLFRSPTPIFLQITKLFLKAVGMKIWNGLAKCAKLLFTAYVAILWFITFLLIWLVSLSLSYTQTFWVVQRFAKLALFLMGCKLKVNQQSTVSGPVIYVANHASYLDAVVLIAVLPVPLRFVAKKELLKIPFLRTMMQKLKVLTVDRVDFSASINEIEQMKKSLQEGNSIAIFPEGTFTYAVGLRPFKLGAFKVAAEANYPICPVAITGTRTILRDNIFILRPHPIQVTIGEEMIPESTEWKAVLKLQAKARAAIAAHCGELPVDF